ncbi:MAG TPA: tetratricopeptide repeat protein, partial [Pyrinomonadaceae bacterium]|nr:tetratricopeptide repeat protein [Pyrinomonadaceae bacterium]
MLRNHLTPPSTIALLVLLLAASVAAGQQRPGSASASSNRSTQQSDATTVFRSARDLITDGDWARAQQKFSEYVEAYPNEKNTEAALYWLAYTQQKLAKYDQCRTTIERLLEKYPNTTWKEDARLLMAQLPSTPAIAYQDATTVVRAQAARAAELDAASAYSTYTPMAPVALAPVPGQVIGEGVGVGVGPGPAVWTAEPPTSDDTDDPCEFKIVVLQALFQTDVQRGIMAATDWLKPGSTQTVRCKGAALTLLGRNGGKAVTPVILGVARNEPDLK